MERPPLSELRIHGQQVLLPQGLEADQVVTLDRGRILGIAPGRAADADRSAAIVAPAFIDIQINGGGGVQFNETPTIEGLAAIAAAARQGGTGALLPTFITAEGPSYRAALAAVEEALAEGVPGILGVHLEGPFLNVQRKGVHDPHHIRIIAEDDLEELCAFRSGIRMITLAPENAGPGTIARLVAAGWIVFAGHTAASWEDMDAARGEGLSGVTHLFNAMEPLAGRSPGVIGSALSGGLYAGIIADGIHVHEANLALAERLMPDRLCLVTDAMKTLATDIEEFTIDGRPVRREGSRLVGPDGQLAGAHLAMDEAVARMGRIAGVEKALGMAARTPAACLGLAGWEIRHGATTPLVLLDNDLRAQDVIG
jgi:N-acetylglucosamine-6-phosphate deacetylase